MARSLAPVDVQVLGEERRHDHARAVVHEALVRELPHRGVDHGIARPAVLPRGQRVGVAVPPVATRPVVAPRGGRSSGEELREEVAPAELPHEGGGAAPSGDAPLDLQRGHAAEVEVRRQAGRGVGGEVVARVVVARHGTGPRVEPPLRLGLAAARQIG